MKPARPSAVNPPELPGNGPGRAGAASPEDREIAASDGNSVLSLIGWCDWMIEKQLLTEGWMNADIYTAMDRFNIALHCLIDTAERNGETGIALALADIKFQVNKQFHNKKQEAKQCG